jgi:hypothetical protein
MKDHIKNLEQQMLKVKIADLQCRISMLNYKFYLIENKLKKYEEKIRP